MHRTDLMIESMEFAHIIAPLSVADFREKYWNRESIHLSGDPDRFVPLGLDAEAICSALSAPLEVGSNLKAQFFDKRGVHREMGIVGEQVASCFAAGMTICRGPLLSDAFRECAITARRLRRSMGVIGQVSFSCYWSPPGGGFGMHYDDRPVFIFQLAGSKRWTYSTTPACEHPRENFTYSREGLELLREQGVSVKAPEEMSLMTSMLNPGDLLYLPAGAWHATGADQGSMGLTLRIFNTGGNAVLSSLLLDLRSQDSLWEAPLGLSTPLEMAGGSLPEFLEKSLAATLTAFKERVARLTVQDAIRHWSLVRSSIGPRPLTPCTLEPSTLLRLADNASFVLARNASDEECLYFSVNGEELEFATDSNEWCKQLPVDRVFGSSEAQSWGVRERTWEEASLGLQMLIDAGVLVDASGAL